MSIQWDCPVTSTALIVVTFQRCPFKKIQIAEYLEESVGVLCCFSPPLSLTCICDKNRHDKWLATAGQLVL